MGRAKAAMMEYEQYGWEETPVNFICPKCKKMSDGYAEVPKIADHHEYEINVDMSLECIWCPTSFDAEFEKKVDECIITLIDHPNTSVEFDIVYYESEFNNEWHDEEYFYDSPDDPFTLFENAYQELKAAIALHASSNGNSSMNRMFFSQSFSMFEAYLCDSYLNLVFLHPDHEEIYIQSDVEAKKTIFSITN